MPVSVMIARTSLLIFCVFGFLVNQVSSERIEGFLRTIPYRCPLRVITGWKCAFCGMTHSWIALFRGDVVTAFHQNLFGPFLFVGTMICLVLLSMNKKIKLDPKPVVTVSITILIIYTVVRNLDCVVK